MNQGFDSINEQAPNCFFARHHDVVRRFEGEDKNSHHELVGLHTFPSINAAKRFMRTVRDALGVDHVTVTSKGERSSQNKPLIPPKQTKADKKARWKSKAKKEPQITTKTRRLLKIDPEAYK